MNHELSRLETVYSLAARDVGRFNLAIFGPTGVGKSTLLNAMFGVHLAETGVGRPVTREPQLHKPAGSTLGIYDTKGLEVGTANRDLNRDLNTFLDHVLSGPMDDHLHVAWYCLAAFGNRETDADRSFISSLAKRGIPVLVVMTQTPAVDGLLTPAAQEFRLRLIEANFATADGQVYPVLAEEDDFEGLKPHGLEPLLKATESIAPAGVSAALVASQQLDRRRKRERASEVVRGAVDSIDTWSTGADDHWIRMIADIAVVYGLPAHRSRDVAVASRLYKRAQILHDKATHWTLIPVVGWLVFTVHAYTLTESTRAIGDAWVGACDAAWRPAIEGGPKWNANVMSGAFDAALEEQLPGIFTIDR